MYHTAFDRPSNPEVIGRLEVVPGNTGEEMVPRLLVYRRHIGGIVESLKSVHKRINADQPKDDVFSQGRVGQLYTASSQISSLHSFITMPENPLFCSYDVPVQQITFCSSAYTSSGIAWAHRMRKGCTSSSAGQQIQNRKW